jgi:hypothetical protein
MEASSLPNVAGPSNAALAIRPCEGLLLALVAGAISWGIIQGVHPLFRVDKKFDVPSIGMPPELFAAHRRQQDFVDRWHAASYVGALGLLVAGALGLCAGLRRRSWLPLLIAPPLGTVGGAIGGPLGCLVYEYVRAQVGQAELTHTIAAQLLVAVPLGLSVGLGLGLATRSASGATRAALAGVIAGVLAAAVYPVAISILLPAASTDALMPEEGSSRLLWLGILSGMLGLVIPIGTRGTQSPPVASPA